MPVFKSVFLVYVLLSFFGTRRAAEYPAAGDSL
jgi:hypothetical protein